LVLFEDIDRFIDNCLGIEIGEDAARMAIKEAGVKIVSAKPVDRQRRDLDPEILKKYLGDLKIVDGTPSHFVYNIDESGQHDWVDKRDLKCYIAADNPAEKVTLPVDRSCHRSTALVCISLSGNFSSL